MKFLLRPHQLLRPPYSARLPCSWKSALIVLAVCSALWLVLLSVTLPNTAAQDAAISAIVAQYKAKQRGHLATDVISPRGDGRESGRRQSRTVRRRRHRISARDDGNPPPERSPRLYYDPASPPELFHRWRSSKKSICLDQFSVYGRAFAYGLNVVVDRSHFRSARRGGERVADVLNQGEDDEFYAVERGAFQLTPTCSNSTRTYSFAGSLTHLNQWFAGLTTANISGDAPAERFTGFTIAVTRYEYANLYHTMTDWYNAFLLMQFFGRTADETNILVVDAHPVGALDTVWPQLFNSTFRLSALPTNGRTVFSQLAWAIVGYESPMTISVGRRTPPLYDEFRQFFLSSYGVESTARRRNCSALSVRFVWRRDYVAHPRNPSGRVQRKILNEAQLIRYVRRRHPEYGEVVGAQVDAMPMRDQLRYVVDADILVGVHGAGLTHAVFLRTGSGLVEIAPNDMYAMNEHFEAIGVWRRLVYRRWTNSPMALESADDGSLTVSERKLDAIVSNVAARMCRRDGMKNIEEE